MKKRIRKIYNPFLPPAKIIGGKKMEKEFGRISKNDDTDIVIRVDDFKGDRGITIREFTKSDRYTGFTKSGTRIPVAKWQEFKDIVNKAEIPDTPVESEEEAEE